MTEAAWVQWHALGGQVAAREPRSVVDPEALILVSLWLQDEEPRFRDMLSGFAGVGSRLLSVQRVRRLVDRFPSGGDTRVSVFARLVGSSPGDPRWRRLAGNGTAAPGRGGKVAAPALRLTRPAAMLLRLRTAFGVDVRTDVLAYLLGKGSALIPIRDIAADLGYAGNTVRGACEALADARFITADPGRPARYHASAGRWGPLLELPIMPTWNAWWQAYAMALALRDWLRGEEARGASSAVRSIVARDWVHRHRAALAALRLEVPDPRDHQGASFVPRFEKLVAAIADWFARNA